MSGVCSLFCSMERSVRLRPVLSSCSLYTQSQTKSSLARKRVLITRKFRAKIQKDRKCGRRSTPRSAQTDEHPAKHSVRATQHSLFLFLLSSCRQSRPAVGVVGARDADVDVPAPRERFCGQFGCSWSPLPVLHSPRQQGSSFTLISLANSCDSCPPSSLRLGPSSKFCTCACCCLGAACVPLSRFRVPPHAPLCARSVVRVCVLARAAC
jgi:hypothetical protein